MRVTKQVRIGLEAHEFAKEYSREYGISISKVMDLAIKYFNGEHEKEKEESEAQFRAIFPNHQNTKTGEKTPKTPHHVKVSTFLHDIKKAMKTGEFWTSSKYSADNINNLDL